MPPASDIHAALGVTLGYLALLTAAELWRWLASPPVEWTRKFVHLGGGIICLSLPFLIQSPWVVLVMALAMAAIFLISRRLNLLKSVHAVKRSSRGTEYYPIVVCLLFFLAHDRPWLYVICILVLAVSDTMAALVGSRYGKISYEVEDEQKSVEGSLAFLIVTFLVVQLPLVLWHEPSLPPAINCVLAALLVAMLVTAFEAISLGGSDNLWVPFGTYVVLVKILRQPLAEIAIQNLTFVAICLTLALCAWRAKALNVGGTLVIILCTYGCWSLGSIDWALPMFFSLGVHLMMRVVVRDKSVAKVKIVMQRLLWPFLVLVAANIAWICNATSVYHLLFGPFLAGCSAVLQQLIWGQWVRNRPRTPRQSVFGATLLGIVSWAAVVLPVWTAQRDVSFIAPVWLGLINLVVAWAYAWFAVYPVRAVTSRHPILGRHLVTGAAIATIAIVQAMGLSPVWHPR